MELQPGEEPSFGGLQPSSTANANAPRVVLDTTKRPKAPISDAKREQLRIAREKRRKPATTVSAPSQPTGPLPGVAVPTGEDTPMDTSGDSHHDSMHGNSDNPTASSTSEKRPMVDETDTTDQQQQEVRQRFMLTNHNAIYAQKGEESPLDGLLDLDPVLVKIRTGQCRPLLWTHNVENIDFHGNVFDTHMQQ